MPSEAPTLSQMPTLSQNPSAGPSAIPSFKPTNRPTISAYPTSWPSSDPSVVPTETPSLSQFPTVSSAPTIFPVAELEQALLEDMFEGHPSSTACIGSSSSSYTYHHSEPDEASNWFSSAESYEEDVFLAELHHEDDDSTKSWTIRIGAGGNIYSLVGAFGEAVPTQYEYGAAFIDDVWQSKCFSIKTFASFDYYIYQSGAYQDDDGYTDEKPFFSPSLGKYCADSTCTFASWNQQAIIPTTHDSPILSFNRYKV